MRIRGLICIAAGLMLTAAAARAEEVTIVSGVLGPEGPLFVDGNLYFVAWTSGTLSKWDGKNTTVLNSQPGCSHNGLALTKQKTFLLACTDEHGAILELDIKGKQLRRSAGRAGDQAHSHSSSRSRGDESRLGAIASHRAQFLRMALGRKANDAIGGVENRLGGAIIGFERDHRRAGQFGGKIENVAHFGGAVGGGATQSDRGGRNGGSVGRMWRRTTCPRVWTPTRVQSVSDHCP